MNLEINIKVPVGAGVSVSQDAQEISQVEAPPPSLEALGIATASVPAEEPSALEPPSLSELGLSEAMEEEAAAVDIGPPSIEMLEGYEGLEADEEGIGPPSLEELGVSDLEMEEEDAALSPEPAGFAVSEPASGGKSKSRARRGTGSGVKKS